MNCRFTATARSGYWVVFDSVTRRYYRGYKSWAEASAAAERFNNDNEMAGQAKAALL